MEAAGPLADVNNGWSMAWLLAKVADTAANKSVQIRTHFAVAFCIALREMLKLYCRKAKTEAEPLPQWLNGALWPQMAAKIDFLLVLNLYQVDV